MAEMSSEEAQRTLSLFLKAYNRAHGTAFDLSDQLDSSDESSDYCFERDGRQLKVQWTCASTIDEHRKNIKFAESVRHFMDEEIGRRQLKGFSITLQFSKPPGGRERQRRIGHMLATLLTRVAHRQPCEGLLFGYEERDWGFVEQYLRPEVQMVEISRIDHPSVLSSISAQGVHVIDPPDDRVRQAILKKMKRYGPSAADLVLVVHFDMDPYLDDFEAEWIRNAAQTLEHRFPEVWTLSDTISPPPRCDRII